MTEVCSHYKSRDEGQGYVCVECGAIADDAVTLKTGENYALDVTVSVE